MIDCLWFLVFGFWFFGFWFLVFGFWGCGLLLLLLFFIFVPKNNKTDLMRTVEEAGLGPKLVLNFSADPMMQEQRFGNSSFLQSSYVWFFPLLFLFVW